MSIKVKGSNSSSYVTKIIKNCRVGEMIEFQRLDSLGKNVKEINDTLRCIYSKKLDFTINSIQVNTKDMKKENFVLSIINTINAVSDIHPNSIKTGIKKAKERGTHVGRKKKSKKDLPKNFLLYYKKFLDSSITKTELAKLCNCSRPTIDNWIKCYNSKN